MGAERSPIVAPSILNADLSDIKSLAAMLNASAAPWIHLDVMDGCFVPNLSFGAPVIAAMRRCTDKYLDVHLMIVRPDDHISAFKQAGADGLTVHFETCPHLDRTLTRIREAGMRAGVAVNPATPVEVLTDVLHLADLVCLMSVNPGFGGQTFLERTYDKLTRLAQMRSVPDRNPLIEVDGGVNFDNAPRLWALGADVLVAGNVVFAHPDPLFAVRALADAALDSNRRAS
ncbi:MAG: ribulose-phosphate 3-epimerase [Bacteroidia bacterium]|nr:ribulose-phosphate 3-epimerase [Bacteroidia bacterium]